jgi:hypothetical protein
MAGVQGSSTTSTGSGTSPQQALPTGSSFLSALETGIEAPFNLAGGVAQAGSDAANNLANAVKTEATTLSEVQIILAFGALIAAVAFLVFVL